MLTRARSSAGKDAATDLSDSCDPSPDKADRPVALPHISHDGTSAPGEITERGSVAAAASVAFVDPPLLQAAPLPGTDPDHRPSVTPDLAELLRLFQQQQRDLTQLRHLLQHTGVTAPTPTPPFAPVHFSEAQFNAGSPSSSAGFAPPLPNFSSPVDWTDFHHPSEKILTISDQLHVTLYADIPIQARSANVQAAVLYLKDRHIGPIWDPNTMSSPLFFHHWSKAVQFCYVPREALSTFLLRFLGPLQSQNVQQRAADNDPSHPTAFPTLARAFLELHQPLPQAQVQRFVEFLDFRQTDTMPISTFIERLSLFHLEYPQLFSEHLLKMMLAARLREPIRTQFRIRFDENVHRSWQATLQLAELVASQHTLPTLPAPAFMALTPEQPPLPFPAYSQPFYTASTPLVLTLAPKRCRFCQSTHLIGCCARYPCSNCGLQGHIQSACTSPCQLCGNRAHSPLQCHMACPHCHRRGHSAAGCQQARRAASTPAATPPYQARPRQQPDSPNPNPSSRVAMPLLCVTVDRVTPIITRTYTLAGQPACMGYDSGSTFNVVTDAFLRTVLHLPHSYAFPPATYTHVQSAEDTNFTILGRVVIPLQVPWGLDHFPANVTVMASLPNGLDALIGLEWFEAKGITLDHSVSPPHITWDSLRSTAAWTLTTFPAPQSASSSTARQPT